MLYVLNMLYAYALESIFIAAHIFSSLAAAKRLQLPSTSATGQIEVFLNHTGFMWDIAAEFRAKLVFAEHRYYGSSMPFGNVSLDNQHIGYLTSSQALADYADLVNYLQGNRNKSKHPVIAFGDIVGTAAHGHCSPSGVTSVLQASKIRIGYLMGKSEMMEEGSYGGMLAAYFRIKYPHLVQGAIAASAPIHQFTGMVPCDVFDRIVTSDFRDVNANCASNIRKSWTVIRNFTKNTTNTDWLKTEWKLCDPVKNQTDVDQLVDFLRSIYETLAMVNYPYDCDFLVPLPGNPVRYVCQFLEDGNLTDKNLLKALGQVINTYTNYTGKTHCVNYKAGSDYGNLDASGWDFQVSYKSKSISLVH
ncbi:Lysosomal Pro-X carboxypeptidase [Eumeta japonica]|uniref:Lysosomal Pro-X carboxypeptidase n=1 Tax=Eumeta variegata TaxID=151549 RepID=A0A4C1YR28_EUMVA|nr:Lysosomal Pro-X carboxypeptidase [Eumeta japonica]